jgi:hypothetical protein
MKSKLCICLLLLPFVLLLVFNACNKAQPSSDKETAADSTSTDISFQPNSTTCPNAPNYGDSVIYIQPKSSGDYTVAPLNNTSVQGTYLSWPEGLSIDTKTGTIDLSQSETGVRYNIAFVKKGTTDTCVSQLILGGITYMDSIYVMSNNDTLAAPIFNANPFAAPPCDGSDDTDYPDNNGNGDNKCSFDDDAPGSKANDQKLRVRTKSGIINLKKSLADGVFGPNLKNGDSKKIKILYQLNDNSKKATQKITVQMVYYDKVSNIPTSLKNEVTGKRNKMIQYQIVNGKPRPPYLIIAGLAY